MKKKGIIIVEIIISFSIAVILITSLYMIVYWGFRVSLINNYYIDVNNILVFLINEIQNNPTLYIEYDSLSNSFRLKSDAIDSLKGKLFLLKYKINGKDDYNIILENIRNLNVNNTISIEVGVVWNYQNKRIVTKDSLVLSTFDIISVPPIPLPPTSDIN